MLPKASWTSFSLHLLPKTSKQQVGKTTWEQYVELREIKLQTTKEKVNCETRVEDKQVNNWFRTGALEESCVRYWLIWNARGTWEFIPQQQRLAFNASGTVSSNITTLRQLYAVNRVKSIFLLKTASKKTANKTLSEMRTSGGTCSATVLDMRR